MRFKVSLLAAVILCTITVTLVAGQSSRGSAKTIASPNGAGRSDWPMFGRDLAGSHYNPNEKILTPATVARLKPKWVFETGGDVSAQPTVVAGVVYFGSWDGKSMRSTQKPGPKSGSMSAANLPEAVLRLGMVSFSLGTSADGCTHSMPKPEL